MMSGFAVSVGCSCPIHVQLRWIDVVQGLDSNRNVHVVVIVAVDAANHANDVFAILSLLDADFDGFVDVLVTLPC